MEEEAGPVQEASAGFDFADFDLDAAALGEVEDDGLAPLASVDDSGIAETPEIPESPEPAAPDDAFAFPEDLDFAESVEEAEAEPATFAEPEEAPEEAPEPEAEEEAFSLFSEDMPENPPAGAKKAPTKPPEEEYDFSIPDFSSPDEAAPKKGAPEEGVPEEGVPEEGAPEESAPVESFGEAAEEATLDSFDTFSLDDEFMASGFGVQKEEKAETEDGFAHLEDFSLEGIDDVFKGAVPPAAAKGPAPKRPVAAVSAEVEEILLSDEDLARISAALASYPLNLRIACEELIAEQAVPPDQMSALVKSLVRGSSARDMSGIAGKLLGRSIPIPRGFEKRTGEELEAERNTFAYAFVHNILPVVRVFALVATVAASLFYLGYEFGYKPIRAHDFYTQGYKRIAEGDYARANERFDQGFSLWRVKSWFYRYAEAFAGERQFLLAEEKYDQLITLYNRDKKGVLDYAGMETKLLRNYEKADRILRHELLDYRMDDEQGLLALGDNNLAWGETEPARYEEARKSYARLMGMYGRKDEYLERMMLYFIRTDNLAETLPLQEHFLTEKKPKIAGSSLAELGGYLLDKKEETPVGISDPNVSKIENLRELLYKAIRADPAHPESYYHLARYFERYGSKAEEGGAISRALSAFEAAPETSARRIRYRIDTHRRNASLLIEEKRFVTAEESLTKGIGIYEDGLQRRILSRAPDFGRLYADLGDIDYFYYGKLEDAVRNYREAERNAWSPPQLRYRIGYADYVSGDWRAAVESFFDASAELPLNRRLLFSLGNSLYLRGDVHAAQGYYTRLLDLLETEHSRFPVLVPNDRPEHAELAERLMRARNNLAVALVSLAERTGDNGYRSRALALYSESARAWDALTRDPDSMVRSGSTNLAFLNTRGILYPVRDFAPQIYAEIDKDVEEPSHWEELLASN